MIELRQDQKQALAFVRERKQVGLFMAPGVGKTIVAIRASKLPALVICRRDDFLTWKIELDGEGYSYHAVIFIESGKDPLPKIRDEGDITQWVIITYDLIKNPVIYEWIKNSQFNQVIADEVHLLKHSKSKRTKAAYTATKHIPNRIGMTGSAISNHIKDVWSICRFIDHGRTFGKNEWKFMKQTHIKSGPGWYPKKGIKDVVAKQLAKMSYHVHEDDVLKLPPIRNLVKSVPMMGIQRRHYESILDEWETQLSDGRIIEIDQVIVQIQKLKQIASGFIYADKKAVWFKSKKIDLLLDLCSDPDQFGTKKKIVVWCSFRAEIQRLASRLAEMDESYVLFYGKMSRKNREHARIQFKNDSSVRWFIGQVDKGVGINELTVADTAFYLSNSRRVVSRQQSMRRIRRVGSENHGSITYVDLITENTIDHHILKCINGSLDVATYIMTEVKNGYRIRDVLK